MDLPRNWILKVQAQLNRFRKLRKKSNSNVEVRCKKAACLKPVEVTTVLLTAGTSISSECMLTSIISPPMFSLSIQQNNSCHTDWDSQFLDFLTLQLHQHEYFASIWTVLDVLHCISGSGPQCKQPHCHS